MSDASATPERRRWSLDEWSKVATVGATVIRLAALFISVLALCVALFGIAMPIVEFKRAYDKEVVREWQTVVVYELIANATVVDKPNKPPGLTFDEIEKAYLAKAVSEHVVSIPKSAWSRDALKLVLVDLLKSTLIDVDYDGRYLSRRVTYDYSLTRCGVKCDVKLAAFTLLGTESGKHDIDVIRRKVQDQVAGTTSTEVDLVLSEMHAANLILIAEDKLVWLTTKAPADVKHGPIPDWMRRLQPPVPPNDIPPPPTPDEEKPTPAKPIDTSSGCCGPYGVRIVERGGRSGGSSGG